MYKRQYHINHGPNDANRHMLDSFARKCDAMEFIRSLEPGTSWELVGLYWQTAKQHFPDTEAITSDTQERAKLNAKIKKLEAEWYNPLGDRQQRRSMLAVKIKQARKAMREL